jgi:hypothetical protein
VAIDLRQPIHRLRTGDSGGGGLGHCRHMVVVRTHGTGHMCFVQERSFCVMDFEEEPRKAGTRDNVGPGASPGGWSAHMNSFSIPRDASRLQVLRYVCTSSHQSTGVFQNH